MLIRLTSAGHRETVHRLRDDVERWLASRGVDQFRQGPRARRAHVDLDQVFDAGEFHGWHVDNRVVAVAALVGPDTEFWTADERADPSASYLGRFMTAEHGRGFGARLLEALVNVERLAGSERMRLDSWKTNRALHDYYRCRGFTMLRVAEVPGRLSGALFERSLCGVDGGTAARDGC